MHWVHVTDGDVPKVHSADDLTQSIQQSALASQVEGSDLTANDAQH
jgi:hypothetical protein